MTKKIGLLMAVSLLAGCNLFNFGQVDNQDVSSETVKDGEVANDDGGSESFSGSLAELFKRGKSITCSIDSVDEAGNRTDGEVYLDGARERMRGEFVMTQADSNSFDGEVINDGEWTYAWSSLQPQGTKFRKADFEGGESSESKSREPFDEDQEADFECQSWRVDDSMFVPPNNIEFIDIGAQINQIQETTQDLDDIKCSACDQLSGEQQAQCLQALGC